MYSTGWHEKVLLGKKVKLAVGNDRRNHVMTAGYGSVGKTYTPGTRSDQLELRDLEGVQRWTRECDELHAQ